MRMATLKYAKFLFVSLAVTLFTYFFAVSMTNAAFLYLDPLSADVYRGDTVALDLRIDTEEGECINTVDGVINYDASVNAVDVSLGDSILSVWVQSPVIDEEARTISFAGGIPGGYCGRIPGDPQLTNVVLTALFRSPGLTIGGGSKPKANIEISGNSQVLLHDGLGTPATLRTQNAILTLLDTPGTEQSDEWSEKIQNDNEPPSDFEITLTRDPSAFSGRNFIIFNALDKQSGIDHYEVFEEPFSEFWLFNWGRVDAPWIRAESPYVLKDQSLNSTIWVKAIDKAGNERINKLVPDQALQSISRDRKLAISLVVGFVVLLSGLVVYALWRRRQASSVNSFINDDKEEKNESK